MRCATSASTPSDWPISTSSATLWASNLLELDRIQDFHHNPTLYVELVGNGLVHALCAEYAPAEVRFQRHHRAPAATADAGGAGEDQPARRARGLEPCRPRGKRRQHRTHRQDPAHAGPARSALHYADAAAPALQSLREFNTYLATTLAGKTSDWRLGQGQLRAQVPPTRCTPVAALSPVAGRRRSGPCRDARRDGAPRRATRRGRGARRDGEPARDARDLHGRGAQHAGRRPRHS